MVPGMGHCIGGEGPDTFDKISLIERWVEKGEAPARVIAAHSTAGQSRSHPSTLPLPASRSLQRRRQYR